jgi:hypothetical protein
LIRNKFVYQSQDGTFSVSENLEKSKTERKFFKRSQNRETISMKIADINGNP